MTVLVSVYLYMETVQMSGYLHCIIDMLSVGYTIYLGSIHIGSCGSLSGRCGPFMAVCVCA